MAQTSGIEQDEAWNWPCPYCRTQNHADSATCAECGAHLREGDDDLFTTIAADNAEVVNPNAIRGREGLWSTHANEFDDDVDDVAEGEIVDSDEQHPGRLARPSRSARRREPTT